MKAATRVVDALGTWCPVPIHLVHRAARRAAPGEVLELLADDPLIEVDLPAWCHASGNELLELRREGNDYVGLVAVTRGRDDAWHPPATARPGGHNPLVAEPLYAIIHEADGDTIWRWQSGRKAKFVEYGGYQRARELAEGSGAVLALWGSQYGRRGVPGDAAPDAVEASVREAIERSDRHI